jgi:hypothetical protein
MNVLISALMAAAILFISSIVTLFANDPALEFSAIPTSVWVSIGGASVLIFIKDFQAITTRRIINKATQSGDGGGQV